MNKQHILDEIVRTAAQNDGIALGRERFFQEIGIKESDWLGKFWARLSLHPDDTLQCTGIET